MSNDKLQAMRDRLPHLRITAPNGLADAKTERLAYALAKYREAVETHGGSWQSWEVVRGMICQGLGCAPSMADAAINELCKRWLMEIKQAGDAVCVKERATNGGAITH